MNTLNNMVFHWPQVVILVMYLLSLVTTISKGKVGLSFITVLVQVFGLWVLYEGGFFHQGVC